VWFCDFLVCRLSFCVFVGVKQIFISTSLDGRHLRIGSIWDCSPSTQMYYDEKKMCCELWRAKRSKRTRKKSFLQVKATKNPSFEKSHKMVFLRKTRPLCAEKWSFVKIGYKFCRKSCFVWKKNKQKHFLNDCHWKHNHPKMATSAEISLIFQQILGNTPTFFPGSMDSRLCCWTLLGDIGKLGRCVLLPMLVDKIETILI
jgi:hypothetical protein